MKNAVVLTLVVACWLSSCRRNMPQEYAERKFHKQTVLPYTPVKQHEMENVDWMYAMLSTIESEHIVQADSVNLSTLYCIRQWFEQEAMWQYATISSGVETQLFTDGTPQMLIHLLMRGGAMPYDAYCSYNEVDYGALCRRLQMLTTTWKAQARGLPVLQRGINDVLDSVLGPAPRFVFFASADYTPTAFAHSVCRPDEYASLTSLPYHPFGRMVRMEHASNRMMDEQLNVCIDSMFTITCQAVRDGHAVCWQGYAPDGEYDFHRGTAQIASAAASITDSVRLQWLGRHIAEPARCVAIVGLATDNEGQRWLMAKASEGTDNPYGGLVYISEAFFRKYTLSLTLPRSAW